MVIYLSFNDQPSGVYASQVVDVVRFLSKTGTPARLVAFVSLRGFGKSKQKIKSQLSNAIVLPMFPGVKNWKWNQLTLVLLLWFMRPRTIMARGIFAAVLARRSRMWTRYFRLVFDARGAYHAEFSEYRIIDNDGFIAGVKKLEQKAIRKSDGILAVSNALIDYWKETYDFDTPEKVEVIPCTLAQSHEKPLMKDSERTALRKQHGIDPNHTLLVYSGSAAGWQSFETLFEQLVRLLGEQAHIRLLLMTPLESLDGTALAPFADRVLLKWVSPEAVSDILPMADYGILLREKAVTNQVASPTKFGEYLAAGLHILISPEIGDYSQFTLDHQCGEVLSGEAFPELKPLSLQEREKAHQLALKHFVKMRYLPAYSLLLGH